MSPRSASVIPVLPVPAVNYFITPHCNMRCRFCFGHFQDQAVLEWHEAKRLLCLLADAGMRKITFVGGEPLLCPWFPNALSHAKELGVTTSVVTNGTLVTAEWCQEVSAVLDWLGVSIDTIDPIGNRLIGRTVQGVPLSVEHYTSIAEAVHCVGMGLKVNTVVSSWNWRHHLADFITSLAPDRWKVFQVLPIHGQNDGHVSDFTVTDRQFAAFRDRHHDCPNVVFETNEEMKASYVMVSPDGRFFDNSAGEYRFSRPILGTGVMLAIRDISVDAAMFERRGGLYGWDRRSLHGQSGSGEAG